MTIHVRSLTMVTMMMVTILTICVFSVMMVTMMTIHDGDHPLGQSVRSMRILTKLGER